MLQLPLVYYTHYETLITIITILHLLRKGQSPSTDDLQDSSDTSLEVYTAIKYSSSSGMCRCVVLW
jgi:hypothetical protein